MKRKLFTALALLLCVSLCLILTPGAFAEGEDAFSVHFYNEKGYDLVGLKVLDAGGSEIAPAETDEGYTYLLTPGAYSYTYHDSLGLFPDLKERFVVSSDMLEIALDLRPVFANAVEEQFDINPYYADQFGESDLAFHAEALQAELDHVVELLVQGRDETSTGFSVGDTSVFFAAEDEVQAGIETLRDALVRRQPSTSVTIYTGSTSWNGDDYNNTITAILVGAFRHTGNQREGDTLLWERGSIGWGRGGTYNHYDESRNSYYHILPFTMEYISTAEQELQTANMVENLVVSLGLNGMSDFDKLRTIEAFLYNNVNYDSTLARHSSYHTLIENNSVCQGFATSFYRLCLAAGLEARVVSSASMKHGWNIAKLGDRYYYVDATWDSNTREYNYSLPLPYYFLRGSDWWLQNHKLDGVSELGDEFTNTSNIFYDPAFAAYNVSSVDFDPSFLNIAVDETNFPDDVFRDYVSAKCDTDGNGYLNDEEIAAVTEINVRGKNEEGAQLISTLKGIEYFPSLLHLDCAGNSLTELDVSKNTALKTLTCGIMDNDGNVFGNQLSKLDVSKNTALEYLYCTHNQISSLDVSNHTALSTLFCYNNDMTQLNISGCTSLTTLSCGNNRLTHLDVSGNTTLESLYCYNNNLSTLTVKNHPSLTFLQCSANSSLDTLDVSGCAELSSLYCQNCGLSILNVTGCTRLTQVGCANNSLSTLDFSTCANLSDLGCQDNALVSLNLTGCSQLSGLGCRNNQLAALDLSSCGNLHGLICNGNPMTSVDITPCPILVLTRYAAEPVVNEGIITYFDDQFGNVISCDETDDILIYALLELPADVTEIEEEAFSDGAFIYVKLAEGTTSVGPRAFADCPNLFIIYVPAQTEIDPTAFDGSYNAYIYRAGADEIVPALQYES